MEQIYEPNESFQFQQLTLSSPILINSGNYFIKYLYNNHPLYIQSPKCATKQGIIKGGKKMYCDFLLTNENESFIRWLEDLENYSQKYIYENRLKWFENDLDMHDIENSFTSLLKVYKSGKYYTVRTIVPTRLGKCTLKIYDENEIDLDVQSIQDNTNVISIWEIQGVKCSSRSFQIDIEIKQMMVIRPTKLFDKCIISRNKEINDKNETIIEESTVEDLGKNTEDFEIKIDIEKSNLEDIPELIEKEESLEENITMEKNIINENDSVLEDDNIEVFELDENEIQENTEKTSILDKKIELVDLDKENIEEDETIQLKDRNDAYYDIYMDSKKKAEEFRNLAILSYLEAKKIKELYQIEDFLENFEDPKMYE